MIEDAGDALGELEAHARVRGFQIARQAGVLRHPGAVFVRGIEQAMDAPGQHRDRKRRTLRHRYHTPDLLPQPLRQVVAAQVGAHPFAIGDRQFEFAPQGAAGHHHLALAEGTGLLGAELVKQTVEQDFEAVREAEMEHEKACARRCAGQTAGTVIGAALYGPRWTKTVRGVPR